MFPPMVIKGHTQALGLLLLSRSWACHSARPLRRDQRWTDHQKPLPIRL